MTLHHIGIACKDILSTLEEVRRTHEVVTESGIVFDSLQDAHVCLVNTRNGVTLELISGPQVQHLVKNRISYYHVCYCVPDVDRAVTEFTSGGAVICSPPKCAALFDGRRVAFVMTAFGLVELLEDAA